MTCKHDYLIVKLCNDDNFVIGLFGHIWKRVKETHNFDLINKIEKDNRYQRIYYKGKHLLVHRIIFYKRYVYLPAQVDHKDTNKHNNVFYNLRAATPSQNLKNRNKYKHGVDLSKVVT